MFVFVTKEDTLKPDDQEALKRLIDGAIQVLAVTEARVFRVVNFLPSDCDTDTQNIKPVPEKQKVFINAFCKILAPITKPDWAENRSWLGSWCNLL